jgi:shikimate dehydrogenase
VLPFVGFNVTMPFKQSMLTMCDEVAMLAKMAGAVNAVHVVDGRFIGYNTDGRGLTESLENDAGFVPEGKNVVLIGAGGAAGAALVGLVLAKAAHITVANRNLERAQEVVDRVSGHARATVLDAATLAEAEQAVREADLVVNATPVGMQPDDPSPIPVEWVAPTHTVFDMVYGGPMTALVREARARGATAVDGLGMLVAQGATSVDIWHDSAQIRTPREVMRAAAEAVIASRGGEGEGG